LLERNIDHNSAVTS